MLGRRRQRRDRDDERWGESRRMRRGDVRIALLGALAEGPAHGYELTLRLERASGGAWRPSPGSVYPTLQLLEDEGLVTSETFEGRRVYALTKSGKNTASERPFDAEQAFPAEPYDLRDATHDLRLAAKQVNVAGTPEQRKRAKAILVEARRQLYELLAKG